MSIETVDRRIATARGMRTFLVGRPKTCPGSRGSRRQQLRAIQETEEQARVLTIFGRTNEPSGHDSRRGIGWSRRVGECSAKSRRASRAVEWQAVYKDDVCSSTRIRTGALALWLARRGGGTAIGGPRAGQATIEEQRAERATKTDVPGGEEFFCTMISRSSAGIPRYLLIRLLIPPPAGTPAPAVPKPRHADTVTWRRRPCRFGPSAPAPVPAGR